MPRNAVVGNPTPYAFFGTYAGVPVWGGGLTLLSAAPGVGKTSMLLRMVLEAAASGIPAYIGCYEHTPDELGYRMRLQAEAKVARAHGSANNVDVERVLSRSSEAVLVSLSRKEDTVRAIEESLLSDFRFPEKGNALLCIDYLSRIPVVGLTGLLSTADRIGEAAVALREMGRRHGWAIIAAAAIEKQNFTANSGELGALAGNEDAAYEADRVLFFHRIGESRSCGCATIRSITLKDRTAAVRSYEMDFWGARFYPALPGERHD